MLQLEKLLKEILATFFISSNETVNLVMIVLFFVLVWRVTNLLVGNEFVSFGVSLLIVDILYVSILLNYKTYPLEFITVTTLILVFNFVYLIVFLYRVIQERISN